MLGNEWISFITKVSAVILNITLSCFYIPVTHDSLVGGDYYITRSTSFPVQKILNSPFKEYVYSMTKTQYFSIDKQLESGIRGFDFRCYYCNLTKKWVSHHSSVITNTSIYYNLLTISKFVDDNPGEFIILHISHLKYNEEEDFNILISQLRNVFLDKLYVSVEGDYPGSETIQNLMGKIIVIIDDINCPDNFVCRRSFISSWKYGDNKDKTADDKVKLFQYVNYWKEEVINNTDTTFIQMIIQETVGGMASYFIEHPFPLEDVKGILSLHKKEKIDDVVPLLMKKMKRGKRSIELNGWDGRLLDEFINANINNLREC
jgi:hypothetical protein